MFVMQCQSLLVCELQYLAHENQLLRAANAPLWKNVCHCVLVVHMEGIYLVP